MGRVLRLLAKVLTIYLISYCCIFIIIFLLLLFCQILFLLLSFCLHGFLHQIKCRWQRCQFHLVLGSGRSEGSLCHHLFSFGLSFLLSVERLADCPVFAIITSRIGDSGGANDPRWCRPSRRDCASPWAPRPGEMFRREPCRTR